MTPLVPEWTIVLLGSWNLAILNPDWFAKKVFGQSTIDVQLLLQNFVPDFRFNCGSVSVIPRQDRVIFAARSAELSSLREVEATARKLLEELPITPVTAIGVNYGFREGDPSSDLSSMFSALDEEALAASNVTIESTTIIRRFAYADWKVSLTRTLDSAGATFSINYHHDVSASRDAAALLQGKTTEFLNHTKDILFKVYGLEEA